MRQGSPRLFSLELVLSLSPQKGAGTQAFSSCSSAVRRARRRCIARCSLGGGAFFLSSALPSSRASSPPTTPSAGTPTATRCAVRRLPRGGWCRPGKCLPQLAPNTAHASYPMCAHLALPADRPSTIWRHLGPPICPRSPTSCISPVCTQFVDEAAPEHSERTAATHSKAP